MKALTFLLLLTFAGVPDGTPNQSNQRSLRKTRWVIVLPKDNPDAFRQKLVDLQALLLLPEGSSGDIFNLCENLPQQPAQFRRIDKAGINALNRLWFISHDQNGRNQVAQALRLPAVPTWYALFIPVELEAELLRKEVAHQGMKEEELQAKKYVTMFEVERKGSTWEVRVMFQGPKKQ